MKAQATNRTERRGICITGELFEDLGFAFREQPVNDYGIDAHAELIESNQATGQILAIQIKSGVSYLSEIDKSGGFVFRPDQDHIDYWLNHALPVVVCLCDVDERKVYWQIVNQVTNEGTKRRYCRNHLPEGRWGDSDAHVVWTFIFPTAEDYSRTLWICRSIWISEDLEEQFRPVGFKGENIGNNIILEWSSYYDELSKVLSEDVHSKEEYLSIIIPMMDELKRLFGIIEHILFLYKNNKISEEKFISASTDTLKRVRELYREGTHLPSSTPFECQDISCKFQSFISLLDNIGIYYNKESLNRNVWSQKNRLWLSIQQSSDAKKNK